MSKTTPVRWWRDDAERYNARPLIGVCRTQPEESHAWAFELLRGPVDPELQRQHAALIALWAPPPGGPDPIADIRRALDNDRREIERQNRKRDAWPDFPSSV